MTFLDWLAQATFQDVITVCLLYAVSVGAAFYLGVKICE